MTTTHPENKISEGEWMKEFKVGIRVEKKDDNALQIMQTWNNFTSVNIFIKRIFKNKRL